MMNSFRVLRLIAGSVLCLMLASQAGAQTPRLEYDEEAETLFRRALSLYSAARYADALTVFDVLLRDYPESHRVTGAAVMRGKALYSMQENLEAAKALRSFLARYPESRYAADAHLTLGWVYDRVRLHGEALTEYRSAWRTLPDPAPARLLRLVFVAMDSVTERHIAIDTLRVMAHSAAARNERAYLWLRVGEREMEAGNLAAVAVTVDTLTKRYAGNPFPDRVARLYSGISERGEVKLGVVLPLMRKEEPSAVKELGTEIHEGIMFAVENHMKDPALRIRVSVDARDTERDAVVASRCVAEFAGDPAVVGIIGPVFSNETREAARVAQARAIPLVSPTANTNGIAALGAYVFQANPDYDTRGRAMARYAVRSRGFQRLGVIAPRDSYGKFLADGFIDEVQKLGARIVAVEQYDRGNSDLKSQFMNLRRAALRETADPILAFGGKVKRSDVIKLVDLGVPISRVDSLMSKGARVRAVTLLGPRARTMLDSLEIPIEFEAGRLDSLEYPVDGIQALYAPIGSPGEIGIVSSQVVYFHFETQLLGSGEWNDIGELEANKRYATGVIFESDNFTDTESASYREFAEGFQARFKKRPGRNTLFGYDTAELMLSLIRNGAGTREALASSLALVRDARGLRSRIGFSPGRVNSWLTIVQYSGDAVQRLEEVVVD